MNLVELYTLLPDGELRLVRSEKELKQKLTAIEARIDKIKPSPLP